LKRTVKHNGHNDFALRASSFRRKPESRLLAHKVDPGLRRDDEPMFAVIKTKVPE
jgi:hypothetical protein